MTPDGSRVLVANISSADISVIDTASNSGPAVWTTPSGPAGSCPSAATHAIAHLAGVAVYFLEFPFI